MKVDLPLLNLQVWFVLGFKHVSLSHQVIPMVRIVPRGFTACADAYLTPHVKRYVQGFASGFKNNLEGTKVLFMQSDGGLTPMQNFNGARAILSGPAGGVQILLLFFYSHFKNCISFVGCGLRRDHLAKRNPFTCHRV